MAGPLQWIALPAKPLLPYNWAYIICLGAEDCGKANQAVPNVGNSCLRPHAWARQWFFLPGQPKWRCCVSPWFPLPACREPNRPIRCKLQIEEQLHAPILFDAPLSVLHRPVFYATAYTAWEVVWDFQAHVPWYEYAHCLHEQTAANVPRLLWNGEKR